MDLKRISLLLKTGHLYLFLFMISELGYSVLPYSSISLAFRKVVLLLGIIYTILYILKIPFYIKFLLGITVVIILHLIFESLNRYGTWFESLNFVSLALVPFLCTGCFVVCIWLGEIKVKEIVYFIFFLFFMNQIVFAKILQHHFNSYERSMTASEAYYLIIPLLYYFNKYLKNNLNTYFYAFFLVFLVIILCFHRTVWMSSIFAISINYYFVSRRNILNGSTLVLRTLFVAFMMFGFTSLFLYINPNLYENISGSILDIQNSDKQGTGSWRSEQRDLYLQKMPDHLFMGWTYEGYDQGELMYTEASEEWKGAKGTFIHSGYISNLYNFGLVGLIAKYGIILTVILFMNTKIYKLQEDHYTILSFITSGLVYSWSYQLPDFYWSFVGIGAFMIYKETYKIKRFKYKEEIQISTI
ncbi:O-antigen ligase family protein [Nostoc sp. CHAB 5834]|nr:O-antigen ligase family protein [Nostoc sp. CHAB 5834]